MDTMLIKETDEAFVQNPLNLCWNEMMYRTGDLAYKNENGELILQVEKIFKSRDWVTELN